LAHVYSYFSDRPLLQRRKFETLISALARDKSAAAEWRPSVYCALLTFLHQRVWCPRQERMVHLAPLNEQSRVWLRAAGLGGGDANNCDGDGDLAFLGAYVFGFHCRQSDCESTY
jgi:hypothetical protein